MRSERGFTIVEILVAVMRRAQELEPADGEHYAYLQEQMEKFQKTLAVSTALSPENR